MKYFNMTLQHCHKLMLHKLFMIMKLSFVFLLIVGIQINATVYSQTKINVNVEGMTIREALKQIERQSDYRFFYSDDLVYLDQTVNTRVSGLSIDETLTGIFGSSDLGYKLYENNLVIVSVKGRLVQQGIAISGTVNDDNGLPMPGVNIIVKGTTTGVISDINGRYTILVPNQDAVLVFSFVGFLTNETKVGDQKVVNVALSEDTQLIEEVVVVGYGTVRKSDLTGSLSQVSADKLSAFPSQGVTEALQIGRASCRERV